MKPTSEDSQTEQKQQPTSNNNRSGSSDSDSDHADRDTPPGKLDGSRNFPIILPRTTVMPTVPMQKDEAGLVMPRKLLNPNLESKEKLQLHKELMFNQKIGKSVLGQKSELKKVMEKRLDNQKKKELEKERIDRRNSFERKLEEQANKLRIGDEGERNSTNSSRTNNGSNESSAELEFLKIHAKLHNAHANDNKNANRKPPLVLETAQRT